MFCISLLLVTTLAVRIVTIHYASLYLTLPVCVCVCELLAAETIGLPPRVNKSIANNDDI